MSVKRELRFTREVSSIEAKYAGRADTPLQRFGDHFHRGRREERGRQRIAHEAVEGYQREVAQAEEELQSEFKRAQELRQSLDTKDQVVASFMPQTRAQVDLFLAVRKRKLQSEYGVSE